MTSPAPNVPRATSLASVPSVDHPSVACASSSPHPSRRPDLADQRASRWGAGGAQQPASFEHHLAVASCTRVQAYRGPMNTTTTSGPGGRGGPRSRRARSPPANGRCGWPSSTTCSPPPCGRSSGPATPTPGCCWPATRRWSSGPSGWPTRRARAARSSPSASHPSKAGWWRSTSRCPPAYAEVLAGLVARAEAAQGRAS